MTERRTKERRKYARGARVDVTRLEHEQVQALVKQIVDRIIRVEQDLRTQAGRTVQLQAEVDRLTAKIIAGFRKR
jgi:hypothetical protein